MALMITAECINCVKCEGECPNEAISPGEDVFIIDPERCTECVGYFDKSQCIEACPADCIIRDPNHTESKEQLKEKSARLKAVAA